MDTQISYESYSARSNTNDFNVFLFNIRSLRRKLDELEALLVQLGNVHILVLSETWMQTGTERFYNIDGYIPYHATRPDGYGGVTVYVRCGVSHTYVTGGSFLNDAVQLVQVHIESLKLDLLAVYRRPGEANSADFINFLDNKFETSSGWLLSGDTNFDLRSDLGSSLLYKDMIADNGMHFLNHIDLTAYTHQITDGPGAPGSIIDHFATDGISMSFNVSVHDTSISDHRYLMMSVKRSAPQCPPEEFEYLDVGRALREVPAAVSELQGASFDRLHSTLTSLMRRNMRRVRRPHNDSGLQWVNPSTLQEMRFRDRLNMMRKQPGLSMREKAARDRMYRRQRNKVTNLIRQAKKQMVDGMFRRAMGDQKRIWDCLRYVLNNRFTKSQTSLPHEVIDTGGNVASDPCTVAEIMVDHFTEIPTKLRNQLISKNLGRPLLFTLSEEILESIYCQPVSSEETTNLIKSLKSGSASGIDQISVRFLKSASELIVPSITDAINQCFGTGSLPTSFKVGRVTPLFKNGDTRLCDNYRPVSVLSNLGKLSEKAAVRRLERFMSRLNIIHPRQFGFSNNSNTTTATLNAMLHVTQSIERGNYTAATFIDVSKAFDCVDHELLLKKIARLGVRGPMYNFIEDYLFGRRQRVQAGSTHSSFKYMRCGVPQGSPLSSVLFLLYINDIFHLPLKGTLQLFADDAMIIYSCPDLATLNDWMNHDLELLNQWFYNNLLTFNVSKTKFMVFTQRNLVVPNFSPVRVGGEELQRIYTHKYLGLVIDSNLTWSGHIDMIKRKVRPFLAALRRTHYLLSVNMRETMYYAHIHPHFLMLISVWGSASETRIRQLSVMQNKAIRHIFWYEYHVEGLSTSALYTRHKILRVVDLIRYESAMMIYKVRKGLLKLDFSIPSNEELGLRSHRRRSLLTVPRSRTDYNRNSILHRGINWYNELPRDVRQAGNVQIFKRGLKAHILSLSTGVR